MKTRIQRWGDSLAFRIPSELAAASGLAENAVIEVALVGRKLVITPASYKSLDELLQGITPENIHEEWDTGPAVGGEVLFAMREELAVENI